MNGVGLEPGLAGRLQRLRFLPKPQVGREGSGPASRRIGAGLEFEDHREYQQGDELRSVDWTVYARLERLVVRRFRQELEEPVIIALDASRSMSLGAPGKYPFAVLLALALATIGLSGGNRVGLVRFGDAVVDVVAPRRGSPHLAAIRSSLQRPPDADRTDLSAPLAAVARGFPGPALVFLLSDLFGAGFSSGLRALRSARADTVVLHVLGASDERPQATPEETELRDVESGETLRVGSLRSASEAYERALRGWLLDVERETLSLGGRYLRMRSDDNVGRLILTEMPAAGIVATRP